MRKEKIKIYKDIFDAMVSLIILNIQNQELKFCVSLLLKLLINIDWLIQIKFYRKKKGIILRIFTTHLFSVVIIIL